MRRRPRQRWTVLVCACLAPGLLAACGPAELPAVGAPPPRAAVQLSAPDDLLSRLPPGARPDPAWSALPVEGPLPAPGPIREHILHAGLRGPGIDLLEVEYTLDRRLHALVRGTLARGGVKLGQVIVLDAVIGDVLAYVSTDPIAFPAAGLYPTASLMKMLTAAAVLSDHPEAAEQSCRYAGSPHDLRRADLTPPRLGGQIDSFWRAIAISNNPCFARLAVDTVGEQGLLDTMRRFGFLEAPAPGHPAGRVDPIEDDLDLGELGSGFAGSFISPLGAARMAAVLANGQLVRPRWIASIADTSGRTLRLPPPEQRDAIPADVARELREIMTGVTQRGSARSAFRDERGEPRLGPVLVSGKTGSLNGRDPDGRYDWFVGVAPAEDPQLAIAAVVVNQGNPRHRGSQVAADVLEAVYCSDGPCRPEAAAWLATRKGERSRL